jgi:hypothetical protein
MRSEISTLLAAVVLWTSAPAQGQSGATDNELYAAYCKGVMDATLESMGAPSTNPQTERLRQSTIAPFVQLRQRFQSYLLSTGVITDLQRENAVFGLTTATQRGQADQRQCFSGILANCQPAAACKVHHEQTLRV